MLDFAASVSSLRRMRRNRARRGMRLPIAAALCAAAAIAAIAILTAAAWHPPLAHADGGASARSQTAASAPAEPIRDYALRILRALTDRDANNWVRYWRARVDCQAVPAAHTAAPRSRVLLALTASICAQLDALLGVNPAAYPPRQNERGAGLLLNEPGAAAGYTLFSPQGSDYAYLIDPLGRIAHEWHLQYTFSGRTLTAENQIDLNHVKLLDNGNLLAVRGRDVLEFDPDGNGNIVWRHKIAAAYLHHDFLKMPNGNLLLLAGEFKTREQAIAAGANPEFVHEDGINYDYLLEVRPAGASGGEIVWEWSTWDHIIQDFDPSKENYGAVAEHPELIDINFLPESISKRPPHARRAWLHTNSVDYNPELDQIMLSPRNFSELWIIDRSATMEEAHGHSGGNSGMGGDLLYRWGNPRAYGHGDADDQRLFWQHQTHWIPPGLPGAGNILLFNNGLEFPGYERFYSSIDEIVPPVDGYRYRRDEDAAYPPDRLVWTYAAETPEDFYFPVGSGTHRLANGNTLITHGHTGTISQVTPDGKTVWKYTVPRHYHISLRQGERATAWLTHRRQGFSRNSLYRAYWYPPDYPGLQALDLAPGAYLEDTPDLLDWVDWARAAVLAGDFGQPRARSLFDIYLDYDENILIYSKLRCAEEDTRAKFFLHIIPSDARDLPAHRQRYGSDNKDFYFNNMHFRFDGGGKDSGDWCFAITPLPNYPIERIRTGQFTREGRLWQADVEMGE